MGQDDASRSKPAAILTGSASREHSSTVLTLRSRSPATFFLLVFALSVPFWLIGGLTERQILPGLPASALALVCPLAAALILIGRLGGPVGVVEHLKRSLDYQRIRAKLWYVPILVLMPLTQILAYFLMRSLGTPLPTPQFNLWTIPALFILLFISALAEELGWSGYALDLLQDRWNAVQASIVLGVVWALWHLVPLVQAGRAPAWIAWWSLGTVSARILHTWLYNNTGKSVFGVALFHAMSNLSWQLFPNHGSHFDPRISGLIVSVIAMTVVLVWGPRTLALRRCLGGACRPEAR